LLRDLCVSAISAFMSSCVNFVVRDMINAESAETQRSQRKFKQIID